MTGNASMKKSLIRVRKLYTMIHLILHLERVGVYIVSYLGYEGTRYILLQIGSLPLSVLDQLVRIDFLTLIFTVWLLTLWYLKQKST